MDAARVNTTVNGLQVGDYLIGSKRTVTGLGLTGRRRSVSVRRDGAETSFRYEWNGTTTMTVLRPTPAAAQPSV